jgi:hypothetical protein
LAAKTKSSFLLWDRCGTAVGVAVGTGGAIQDRADDFQTAIDRRRTGAGGKPIAHKGLQRSVVDLLWF